MNGLVPRSLALLISGSISVQLASASYSNTILYNSVCWSILALTRYGNQRRDLLSAFSLQLQSTMRRRVTFIQRHDSSFDPSQTDLTSESLSIRNLDAIREDRLSVPADELPSEVS